MFVTLMGVVWIVLHFTFKADHYSNTFGYMIIVLRFFTIIGKHVSSNIFQRNIFSGGYFLVVDGLHVSVCPPAQTIYMTSYINFKFIKIKVVVLP